MTESSDWGQRLTLKAPPVSQTRLLVCGEVEHGDQRGRLLGFPTANIGIGSESIAPPDGVFAGYAFRPNGDIWPAAISVGRRPTFYEERGMLLLEAHLLDFEGDLYGEVLTVEIAAKLRNQIRFEGPEELKAQLAIDIANTRQVLLDTPPSVHS